jgi:hypothetical protein
MFLVNSRYPLVTATFLSAGRKPFTQCRHTFFRSYGANLPSSLTTVLSSALGCSPCLPVSVCGTVDDMLRLRLFLEVWNYPVPFTPEGSSLFTPRPLRPKFISSDQSTGLNRDNQRPAGLSFSVPSTSTHAARCRNINLLSITYALRPRLRIRLTLGGLTFPRKP